MTNNKTISLPPNLATGLKALLNDLTCTITELIWGRESLLPQVSYQAVSINRKTSSQLFLLTFTEHV